MITYLAMLVVQMSAPQGLQFQAGIAMAPGVQVGPVVRVGQAWPVSRRVSFQVEGAFGLAGSKGVNTNCGITGQCFSADVEHRARELEIPTLFVFSVGRQGSVFFTAGPVFALRITCDGKVGSSSTTACPNGSDAAWGGALGVGIRTPFGLRMLTMEARLQQFATPIVQMYTSDAGAVQAFRPRALTVTMGWGRR